jgi:hypothetical protein
MKKDKILSYLTHLFLLVFFIIYLTQKNYEFVGYTAITLALLWIMLYIYKKYNLPFIVLLGFVVWVVLHMFGGTDINGARVYGIMLIDLIGPPLFILRYDQLVHFYCYLVVGTILYHITKQYVKKIDPMVLFLVISASIGIGSLNEIAEFTMVLLLENTGVGDFYNASLDLVFNTIGAIVGVLTANYYNHKKQFI